ncbi:MAG TPA: trypsin-like peptidase domain-containing protein [Mycobacteriales bacterium]|jgi:putative serine protease PepD|nr:trypsin-like peptidase domain-containing protein [Mycobacteriales bacterium]
MDDRYDTPTPYTTPDPAPDGLDETAIAAEPKPPRASRRGRLGRTAGIGALVIAAAVGSGVTVHALDGGPQAPVAAKASTVAAVNGTSDVTAALAKISPSVVLINDTITSDQGGYGTFGGPGSFGGGQATSSAAGTGIVITSDGEIVTNAHVVNGASNIKVTLSNGKAYSASIVGIDTTADLAVIKVSGAPALTPATFASSSKVAVGDSVIAVGNAEGYGGSPTVTEGIVSAKNRALSDQDENLSGLLQTDAAINPGNSGGPLVDTNGDVIGINTAVATGSTNEPAQNIGFAIASDTVTKALPALKAGKGTNGDTGSSSSQGKAFLGVSVSDNASYTGAPGALVQAVESGSPAASAGLRAGDVITAVGGTQVSDAQDLVSAIASAQAGQQVTLTVTRDGSRGRVQVTLGSTSS